MKPSLALNTHKDAIRALTQHFRASNPRVFGSVLRGEDKEGSDLDLLVDPAPNATLFDMGGLHAELESTLGVQVDLVTPRDLPLSFRAKVLAEARPL